MEPERNVFVVRIVRDEEGKTTGVVEHVRSGAKAQFAEVETVGALIGRMLARVHPLAASSISARNSPRRGAGPEPQH